MCGNIVLLTGLCVVWFITKTRGDVALTNLTRGYHDTFTNLFCKKCSEYNAKENNGNANVCECQSGLSKSGSLFLRSKRSCTYGEELMGKAPTACLFWKKQQVAEVIDTEDVNSTYIFGKPITLSCQSTQSIVFLDALGKWQPFNMSENVLKVKGPSRSRNGEIKVTHQSPSLTNLSSHILKLNLICNDLTSGSVQRCLIFKVKGVLNFPLCNYTTPTTCTTPLPSPTTPTSALRTSTVTNGDITSSTTTTTTPAPPGGGNSDWIIAAIVIIGIVVLFLALIGAFLFLFKHHYICTFRSRQDVAREFDDFAVINSPGQQSYRFHEEPVYVEIPAVHLSNRQIAGNSVEKSEYTQSTEELVLSNSYTKDASLPRARPLPSRPDIEENRHMENSTTPVYQNDGHEVNVQRDVSMVLMNPGVQVALLRSLPGVRTDVDDFPPAREENRHMENSTTPAYQNDGHEVNVQRAVSMVLMNPGVQVALSRSLPTVRTDFDDSPPAREKRKMESDHHHQHHHGTADGAKEDKDVDYQGLEIENRAKSIFICSSCNENSDYQRLSRPGHCPHKRNNEGREKSASFYESLTLERERGTRESFYASPSRDDEDEERNADQIPEYQILEPEETGSDEVLDESVDHDYNVLEEPEPANGGLDEDNNTIDDPRTTGENSGEPLEPSVILDTKDNPAYAIPLKKTITEKPEPVRSELDEDNNKTRDPRPSDKNPEEPFEPPVFLKIDNNPLYSLPWMKNITDESGRKRSYRSDEVLDESVDHDYNELEEPEPANGELDEDNNKIDDPRTTGENSGEPLEPSAIIGTEDNPAYAVPLKKTITDKPEPVRSELDEDNNKTRDPRPADENPEEPFEPLVFLKIDNNPLYSLPWKKNITDESGRKRSYSM